MDWLRRNWPDLLIGIALIAVIAGIVATLLTGGSFFPVNTGTTSPPTVTSPNVDPVPPTTDTGVPEGGVQATTPAPDASTPGETTDPEDTTPGNGGGAVAVLPPAGESGAATSGEGADAGATDPSPDATDTTETTAPSVTADTPAPTAETTTSATVTDAADMPSAPYRVSVGAFGSEANAQRQAATFQESGFPVFIGRQGDLYLVLVGPYDTEAQAEQAVARIRSGDFGIDPVIYLFEPDDAEASAPPAAEDATETEPATATESTTATTTEPAPAAGSDGTFLQVGAYGNRESALPQIEQLQELGFEVSERTESGLIKLLVGPFTGDDLAEARQVLQSEGIEHFAR